MVPKAEIRFIHALKVFRVVSTLYGMTNPVGPRLERLKPLPDTSYDFRTRKEAEEARKRLQDYFDEYHKPPRRKGSRKRR